MEGNTQLRVQGTFLGKPIDLTLYECAKPEESDGQPDKTDPVADTTVSQPAPDAELPKAETKPPGNAEQL